MGLKKGNKFISVALCTYNGEKFLEEQLESILCQTIDVDEIVISDDASSDSTCAIIQKYCERYPDLIKFVSNPTALGTIKNFEKTIQLTTGDLIFLSDQDDIWMEDKVELMLSFFQENNNCLLLFTDGDLINNEGLSLKTSLWNKWGFSLKEKVKWKNNNEAFFDLLDNKNKITGATVCIDKRLKTRLPIIGFPFFYHDAFFGLHASALNGLFFLDCSLIKYRVHDKQQVGVGNNLSLEQFCIQNNKTISKKQFQKIILNTYRRKIVQFGVIKFKNKFF